jgi:hypothetical protein
MEGCRTEDPFTNLFSRKLIRLALSDSSFYFVVQKRTVDDRSPTEITACSTLSGLCTAEIVDLVPWEKTRWKSCTTKTVVRVKVKETVWNEGFIT